MQVELELLGLLELSGWSNTLLTLRFYITSASLSHEGYFGLLLGFLKGMRCIIRVIRIIREFTCYSDYHRKEMTNLAISGCLLHLRNNAREWAPDDWKYLRASSRIILISLISM